VDVKALSAEDRDHLREALRRLEPMQEMVRDVLAD
jgi:signal-transduction protein with cAMP-binding, CBS, and nucleotidyltransferase domain